MLDYPSLEIIIVVGLSSKSYGPVRGGLGILELDWTSCLDIRSKAVTVGSTWGLETYPKHSLLNEICCWEKNLQN